MELPARHNRGMESLETAEWVRRRDRYERCSHTSTHSADVSSAIREGVMRTALWVEPAAGTTTSNAFSDTSQYTGSGVFSPNGQTPPTSWPVISATSSRPSILGLPPNIAFTFLLSIRDVPAATINTTRSPIRRLSVFAILAGSPP